MFANKQIEKYYRQCETLLNFTGVSWWIIDLEEAPDVFYCNKTMCDTFHLGNDIQHSISKTCPIAGDYNKFIAIKSSVSAQEIYKEYDDLKNNKIAEYDNRFPYYDETKDKVLYFSSRAKALVRNEFGKAILLLGIIEPEAVNEELYKQASIDSLTGLKNRRAFDSQLQFMLNLAKRERRTISLLMFDIDHFKEYNDCLGHYSGDLCLMKIAGLLTKSCCRETDIVCRYGGEEFAIVTYGDSHNTLRLAENVRRCVYESNIPHPKVASGRVTVSAGYISVLADEQTTPRSLIESADCGLYLAKRKGRDQSICGLKVNENLAG
jgi:diguanylate cyclase (GGDEF)-like protein